MTFIFGKPAPSGKMKFASEQTAYTPQAPNPNDLHNGLPFMSGDIIPDPTEEADLRALGWKPGDPIPANLAQQIAAIRQDALNASGLPVAPDTPPLKVPDPVPIEELPEHKRREIRAAMAEAVQQAARLKRAEKLSQLPGSIRDAVQAQEAAATEPRIVKTTENPPKEPERRQEAPEAFKPKDPEPANLAENQEMALGAAPPAQCKHCGWPADRDDVTPSEDDKYLFLEAVLGRKRFEKEYSLLDGRIKLTFRTLLSSETDMILEQLRIDVDKSRVTRTDAWYERMMDYRLALSLSKIYQHESGLTTLPPIGEHDFSGLAEETPVRHYLTQFMAQVLPVEQLRRQAGQQFARFQRVVDHLEARMDDANFWKGIG